MYFTNEYTIKCDQIGEEVTLESSVEASAGMGCMVNYDHIDYICSRQLNCRFYRKEQCLLSTKFDFEDWKS